MENSLTNIVVIKNNLSENAPLIVKLREIYGFGNVFLFDNADKGKEFVLANLQKRLILVLGSYFGFGNTNGISVFRGINDRTKLVPIIYWQDNENGINNAILVEMLNSKIVYAFFQLGDSYSKFIEKVQWIDNLLSARVDCVLEEWISRQEDRGKAEHSLMTVSGREVSLQHILTEIRNQTEEGKGWNDKILKLTISLLNKN